MVKNNNGGNKTKKQARKNSSETSHYASKGLRLPNSEEPDEKLAVVTKMYGHGQIEVQCIDNKSRLCIIRNKFKGKGKHNSLIKINMWILVGVRSWEVKNKDKKQVCDLLEIYSEEDKQNLKERCNLDFNALITQEDIEHDQMVEHSNVEFLHDTNDTSVPINTSVEIETFISDDEDEINFDEI